MGPHPTGVSYRYRTARSIAAARVRRRRARCCRGARGSSGDVPAPPSGSLAPQYRLHDARQISGRYARALLDPATAAFASDAFVPTFTNVSQELGLSSFTLSGSVVADDFDGDNQIDLLVSSYHPSSQLRLFLKRRSRGFDERTEQAGLLGLTGGLNMVQGDYDNDGDVDVLVLRGAWLGDAGRHPNSLLRNNGDGTLSCDLRDGRGRASLSDTDGCLGRL
ncbi:MAG: VCBS repeat-containing protein [Acidobacteria bacterium]|nr:MAG: VCBS repeat-containing protein [Acidobacteriota bacterium]